MKPGNVNRKPVSQSEDGTDIYPLETNCNMFIDLSKIEKIEDVEDFQDWFVFPSERHMRTLKQKWKRQKV